MPSLARHYGVKAEGHHLSSKDAITSWCRPLLIWWTAPAPGIEACHSVIVADESHEGSRPDANYHDRAGYRQEQVVDRDGELELVGQPLQFDFF
jgi:hypothetical protein